MGNGMGGNAQMNGKKTWTTPVIGIIQLNSAQTGGPTDLADSKQTTRKS
jgi:hypothetical protein